MYVLNNFNSYHKHVQRITVLVYILNQLTFNTVLYTVYTSQIYLQNILLLNIYKSSSEE